MKQEELRRIEAEDLRLRKEASIKWQEDCHQAFENAVKPKPIYRIRKEDDRWRCEEYFLRERGRSDFYECEFPGFSEEEKNDIKCEANSWTSYSYCRVALYKRASVEPIMNWKEIGPMSSWSSQDTMSQSRFNRFSTYDQAYEWLKVFSRPTEYEYYFDSQAEPIVKP